MQIGAIIQKERERQGMKRADLARAVGVPWSQIQKWESQESLQADRLLQIALALNVPLSTFLGDEVRTLEGVAGISPSEQSLVARYRALPFDEERAEADRMLELDEDGRGLVRTWQDLDEEGRTAILMEASRQRTRVERARRKVPATWRDLSEDGRAEVMGEALKQQRRELARRKG